MGGGRVSYWMTSADGNDSIFSGTWSDFILTSSGTTFGSSGTTSADAWTVGICSCTSCGCSDTVWEDSAPYGAASIAFTDTGEPGGFSIFWCLVVFWIRYGKKQKCKSSGPFAIFSKSNIGAAGFFFSSPAFLNVALNFLSNISDLFYAYVKFLFFSRRLDISLFYSLNLSRRILCVSFYIAILFFISLINCIL